MDQNQNQNNLNQQGADKTFSQADVDRIVADRLARESKKYADYDDLKKAKEELDQMKQGQLSEVEKLKAALDKANKKTADTEAAMKALQLTTLKSKLCVEAGLSGDLASRVQGEDETAIKADIEALKKLFPGTKPMGGSGAPASNNAPKSDLQSQYNDALKAGNIELAMLYKRQLFESNI